LSTAGLFYPNVHDRIVQVNPLFYTLNTETPLDVRLERVCDAAELDEQWSFVGNKSNQRMIGVPMSAILHQKRMKLAKQTRKKLNERILILEPGLNA
jgi:hypothetical protein